MALSLLAPILSSVGLITFANSSDPDHVSRSKSFDALIVFLIKCSEKIVNFENRHQTTLLLTYHWVEADVTSTKISCGCPTLFFSCFSKSLCLQQASDVGTF